MARNLTEHEISAIRGKSSNFKDLERYLEDMKEWENGDNAALKINSASKEQKDRVELRKDIREQLPKDNTTPAGESTDTVTPVKSVVENKKGSKKEKVLTEEQQKQLKIEEMLEKDTTYKKIADEIKKAEEALNTEITRRKTHIARLKIKAKEKANMIFGELYAKGNLK